MPLLWRWNLAALSSTFLALRLGLYAFLGCVAWVRIIEEVRHRRRGHSGSTGVQQAPGEAHALPTVLQEGDGGAALSAEALRAHDAGIGRRGRRRASPAVSEPSSLAESMDEWCVRACCLTGLFGAPPRLLSPRPGLATTCAQACLQVHLGGRQRGGDGGQPGEPRSSRHALGGSQPATRGGALCRPPGCRTRACRPAPSCDGRACAHPAGPEDQHCGCCAAERGGQSGGGRGGEAGLLLAS